jgi:hypothetical protein
MKRDRRGVMPHAVAVAIVFYFCYDTSDLGARCLHLKQRRWDIPKFSIHMGGFDLQNTYVNAIKSKFTIRETIISSSFKPGI